MSSFSTGDVLGSASRHANNEVLVLNGRCVGQRIEAGDGTQTNTLNKGGDPSTVAQNLFEPRSLRHLDRDASRNDTAERGHQLANLYTHDTSLHTRENT
jgi:hypothetical protein